MAKKNFIADAIKRPGAFSKKAKGAGMTTREYAEKQQHAPGRTGQQARFALELAKFSRKRK